MDYGQTAGQQVDVDEAWRRYMSEHLERQSRLLREIADNTAASKALSIVLLALIAIWIVISLVMGVTVF